MCLPWHHMSAHTALWVDGRAIRCVHRQLVDPPPGLFIAQRRRGATNAGGADHQ